MAVWSEISATDVLNENRIDSDYYQIKYLANDELISKLNFKPLKKLSKCITDFGAYSQNSFVKYLNQGKHRFIRNGDIGDFFIEYTNDTFIDETVYNKLSLHLEKSDILIQRTGSLGKTAIVLDKDLPSTANQNLAQIKIDDLKINPFYVLTFMNCKYGIILFERMQTGNVQPWLNLGQIEKIKVPLFDKENEDKISGLVKESFEKKQLSQSFYTQAQELLERELGLDKLVFDKPLSYEARLSEVVGNKRADAEFYHAKFKPLIDVILNYKNSYAPLYKLSSEITPNVDLGKETGEYDYIEIGDISISDGSYSQTRLNISELPANAKIKLSGGELLISQVRPTRGAISIISDELPYRTISSGAFYTCTINDLTYREIIWLYIRCIKSIFEKFCGGTSYPTIDSHYIRKLPVPLFEKDLASKVRQLVLDSKKAKIESQQLLEQAKRRVEELIEQAVQK